MRQFPRVILLLTALAILAGCDSPTTDAGDLRTSKAALAAPDTSMIEKHARQGEQLLAVGHRGALIFGTPDEALEHTDQPLLFIPRHVGPDGSAASLPDGLGKISAAYTLPGEDAILFLTEDHRLTQWNGEALEVLDREVQGPVSISPSGKLLAYLKGEEPIYSVILRDRATNKTTSPSKDVQGCWSPAVGDDGSVAFMSSNSGYAELYLARRGGAPERVTSREQGQAISVPSGPSAPLLVGEKLYFEDQAGLQSIDLGGKEKPVSTSLAPNLRDLVWSVDGTRVWGTNDGRLQTHALGATGGVR